MGVPDLTNVSRTALERAAARASHLRFIKHTWQKETEPFKIGTHTKEICASIDTAFDAYRKGESHFQIYLVPVRHGKSDTVSRHLPPHFLGEFPDDEVLLVSYNATKAYEFSRAGKKIIESLQYAELYPEVELSKDKQGVDEWEIEGRLGRAQYIGIGGGSAGKGGNLIIIDDVYSNRQEAESETIRDSRWQSFRDDIMTRRAPRCIVIIAISPWHTDDIIGRIKEEMSGNENFPQFKTTRYPAFSDTYTTGYLFPERFDSRWYETQRAVLGTYGTASLLQCEPVPRTGNMMRVDMIREYDKAPSAQMVRAWDLASSKKERVKDDPDFTVGVKGCVVEEVNEAGIKVPVVYVEEIKRGQWESLERQETIKNTAIADGAISIGVEAYGAYKDAYTELRDTLRGVRVVKPMQLSGDKVAKASILEPIMEAGNFRINKNISCKEELIKELTNFPNGKHDDIVDAVTLMVHMQIRKKVPGMFVI